MPKKIYDITPPKPKTKLATKQRVAVRKKVVVEKMVQPESEVTHTKRTPMPSLAQPKRFPSLEVSAGALVLLFLLSFYLYRTLPWAHIEIYPAMDSISLEEKVLADKSVTTIDAIKNIIPAKYIEETKTSSQQFLATGSASNDGKASGTITVYNKISPSTPLSLKIGTHFLSDGGKYFVTLKKITIPAMVGKVPGSIKVEVQAEDSGTDFNISASKFSVPKLSGTSYYYGIWAESSTAMTGGYAGKVKKITASDIAQAKEVLTKQLIADATEALKNKISVDEVLLDGAITSTVVSTTTDVKADTIADNFNETANVKVMALAFKKQDLQEFVKNNITAQLPEGKNVKEESIDIQYALSSIDMKKGTESIALKFSAKTYYAVDTRGLAGDVSEKSADQVKDAIMKIYDSKVSDVKTTFWPFWVSEIPVNKNRVIIDVNTR